MAMLGVIGLYVYNDIIMIESIINRLKIARNFRGIWFKTSIIRSGSAAQFLCTPFDHMN